MDLSSENKHGCLKGSNHLKSIEHIKPIIAKIKPIKPRIKP
jgi:hypothetical protein